MRQFCLFTKSFNQKWTSSVKIIFCQNRDRFPTALGPSQRIVDGANGHLASVLESIESCKERDVSLYGKFAKLSCEKGEVLVHDEELRDLDRSLTLFPNNGNIFIRTSVSTTFRCWLIHH